MDREQKPIRRRKDRPPREAEEVLADAQRFVRAMGRRVEDPDHLVLLRNGLHRALAEAELIGVTRLRERGYSDRMIGEAFGLSRWAVMRRWPRPKKVDAT